MHEISLTYRNKIFHRTRKHRIPESWQECSQGLRAFAFEMLLKNETLHAKLIVLRKIIGSFIIGLSDEVVAEMVDLISWCDLNRIDIPLFHEKSRKGFEYATAFQYAACDELSRLYIDTGEEKYLNKMVYAIRNKECYKLEDLQEVNITMNEKLSDLFFFMNVKKLVFDLYGEWLFSGEGSGDGHGWWGIYMDVARDGIFGKLEDVYKSDFHDVCLYLVKRKKEEREQLSRMEKMKADA